MKIAGRLSKASPSATLKLTSKAKEMRSQGLPVINFGAGEPDFDTPQSVKEEAIRCLNAGFTKIHADLRNSGTSGGRVSKIRGRPGLEIHAGEYRDLLRRQAFALQSPAGALRSGG